MLRIGAFPAGPCAPYAANPSKAVIDQCNSWLGPNQPGITTPDPTEGNISAQERAERRSSTPEQRERQRGPGEPEAPPTPGKPDPSKPQIVLPNDVRELLDRLKLDKPLQEQLPQAPKLPQGTPNDVDTNQLLDYLLGP